MQEFPFMPKATAVWLVENTNLTFRQIANFCNLHELEVKGIADGDVAKGIKAYNPILAGQLTREEIDACSKDPERKLNLIKKHKSKNSFLFLQDYSLKSKFRSFKSKLIVQDTFLNKNKISIINKNFNKYLIITNKKSYNINSINEFMIKNILTIMMVYNKIFKTLDQFNGKNRQLEDDASMIVFQIN